MYDPFMFSTLLFILYDPTVYRFSLATRCGSYLTTFTQPLHLDQVTTLLSWLYLNAFSFGLLSATLRCPASSLPHL